LCGKVGKAECNVGTLEALTKVGAVSSEVDAVSSEVDAVSSEVDDVSSEVDDVSSEVDAVGLGVSVVSLEVEADVAAAGGIVVVKVVRRVDLIVVCEVM